MLPAKLHMKFCAVATICEKSRPGIQALRTNQSILYPLIDP